MINFTNTSQSVTDADLDFVEKRFGFSFPAEFRTHYLKFNGGRPEKNRLVLDDGISIVHQFLPIKYGKASLLLEHDLQELKVNQSLIPEYLVPFAIDPGGDYYCFNIRTSELGAIYAFHMDHAKNPERAMERLASSLSEFFAKLRSKGELRTSASIA
jgi:hypothetical protein